MVRFRGVFFLFLLCNFIGLAPYNCIESVHASYSLHNDALNEGLPIEALAEALTYMSENQNIITRTNHLAIADFDQHSSQKRLFIVDLKTNTVQALQVAHGVNSDPENTGYATTFSNVPDSRMSSLGFYRVAEKYFGKYGDSLRLDGLETLNNRARDRAIVVHSASYVNEDQQRTGRSWGCPALDRKQIRSFIEKFEEGGLLYLYVENISQRRKEAELQALVEDYIPAIVNEAEDAPIDGE